MGFSGNSAGKEFTRTAGNPGLIPGSGSSPGEGRGYPCQYSWASLLAQTVKKFACNAGDQSLIPGSSRSPGGEHGNPLQYSCLENIQGQKSLLGYSPWDCKESYMTEWLRTAHIALNSVIPTEEIKHWREIHQNHWVFFFLVWVMWSSLQVSVFVSVFFRFPTTSTWFKNKQTIKRSVNND